MKQFSLHLLASSHEDANIFGMRTTVDIPDELFRRAKSEAALRGRKLKDFVEEGLRLVLEKEPARPAKKKPTAKPRAGSLHEALQDLCGIFEGPSDLSTNKKYFDDFGR
jgi:hypothetical protein